MRRECCLNVLERCVAQVYWNGILLRCTREECCGAALSWVVNEVCCSGVYDEKIGVLFGC